MTVNYHNRKQIEGPKKSPIYQHLERLIMQGKGKAQKYQERRG